MRLLDADGADGVYELELHTALGKLSLLPPLQAGVTLSLHGSATALPAAGFTIAGNYSAVSAALGGVSLHATECDFAPGACESRFSTLTVTARDSTGDVDTHAVIVDVICIAEVPLLQAPDAVGDEDTAIALTIVATPRDPLERVTVYLEGFPPGVTFNQGQAQSHRWRLELHELAGLTVAPSADSHDDFGINITAVALEVSNGDTASNSTQLYVTVNAVNDAPDVAAPGTQYALEDAVSRIQGAIISDRRDLPDGLGGDYEVTVSVSHGVLFYGLQFGNESTDPEPSCAAVSLSACNGYGTASVSLRGRMENVNTALGTLFFLGNTDYEGQDVVFFNVNDHGTEGSGEALHASDKAPLIVLPVNDAPTIALPSQAQLGCESNVEDRTCLPIIDAFRPREDCNNAAVYLPNGLQFADIDEKGDNFTVFLASHFGLWTLNPFADYTDIAFERGDGLADRALMFHGALGHVNAAVSYLRYEPLPDFHGEDALTVTIKDRPVDGTGAGLAHAAYSFAVRPVNDAPLLSVAASQAIVQLGGSTTFSLNVLDDQYLNTSLAVPTALPNSQTRVRVYMLSTDGSFVIMSPGAATVINNGQPLVAVDGTIEDVNDALLDVTFVIDASVDGTLPTRRFATAHFVVDDYGREGFCTCTSDPGSVEAPLSSCNRFVYGNHSILVLDCVGDTTETSVGPALWYYGDRPLDTFSDVNDNGLRDQTTLGMVITDLSVPASDNRTDWNLTGWQLGAGGFGYLDEFSPCPLLTSAGVQVDLTDHPDLFQVMIRSWFFVQPGTIAVTVRLTSDWPLHLYVNGDLVGSHPGTPGHQDSAVCPTNTDVRLALWFAPDYPHRYEDDTYLNEISLLAHPNATYLDADVLAVHCDDPGTCRSTSCRTNTDCGPTCSCGERLYDAATDTTGYHFAGANQPVEAGSCFPNRCGNGIVDLPVEECDDGNLFDNDGCSNLCRRTESEGGCFVGSLTLDEAHARLQAIDEALQLNPGQPALIEEREFVQRLIDRLTATGGPAIDGREDGFDRFGRFCSGRCPSAGQGCEAVWSADGGVLEQCLCSDAEPSTCAVHVIAADNMASAGLSSATNEVVDVFGRYCSGICAITGERCAGDWARQQGRNVLLGCACRGAGCYLDRRANSGAGACGGACAHPAELGFEKNGKRVATPAQQMALQRRSQRQCVPTFFEDVVASCDCPAHEPSECTLKVDAKGKQSCEGKCLITGKACVLERGRAFGDARCTCRPKEPPTGRCRPNYYTGRCEGSCSEPAASGDNVCLPEFYAPSGKPEATRLLGCKCQPRVSDGCILETSDGQDPVCSGECKSSGKECRLSSAAGHVLCGCSQRPQNGGSSECRLNRDQNLCQGVSCCGLKVDPEEWHPTLVSGSRVLGCGCPPPIDGHETKPCFTRNNLCYGGCTSSGLPCRGTYIDGKLRGCGCPDSTACRGCVTYQNEPCVTVLGCRGQSSVRFDVSLTRPTQHGKPASTLAALSGVATGRLAGVPSGPVYLHLTPTAPDCDAPVCEVDDSECLKAKTKVAGHDASRLAQALHLSYATGMSFELEATDYRDQERLGPQVLERPFTLSLSVFGEALEGMDVSAGLPNDAAVFYRPSRPKDTDTDSTSGTSQAQSLRPLTESPSCSDGSQATVWTFSRDTLTLEGTLCATGAYFIMFATDASQNRTRTPTDAIASTLPAKDTTVSTSSSTLTEPHHEGKGGRGPPVQKTTMPPATTTTPGKRAGGSRESMGSEASEASAHDASSTSASSSGIIAGAIAAAVAAVIVIVVAVSHCKARKAVQLAEGAPSHCSSVCHEQTVQEQCMTDYCNPVYTTSTADRTATARTARAARNLANATSTTV